MENNSMNEEIIAHHLDDEQIKYFKSRLSKLFSTIKKKYRENRLKEIDNIYNEAFIKIKENPEELFTMLLNNLKHSGGELFVYNDVMFDLTNSVSLWIETRNIVKSIKEKIDIDCDEHCKQLNKRFEIIVDDVVLHGSDPVAILKELEFEASDS